MWKNWKYILKREGLKFDADALMFLMDLYKRYLVSSMTCQACKGPFRLLCKRCNTLPAPKLRPRLQTKIKTEPDVQETEKKKAGDKKEENSEPDIHNTSLEKESDFKQEFRTVGTPELCMASEVKKVQRMKHLKRRQLRKIKVQKRAQLRKMKGQKRPKLLVPLMTAVQVSRLLDLRLGFLWKIFQSAT